MIAYQPVKNTRGQEVIKVKLDGRLVGHIKTVVGGFQYFPKGRKSGGEVSPTLNQVKDSLEGDE